MKLYSTNYESEMMQSGPGDFLLAVENIKIGELKSLSYSKLVCSFTQVRLFLRTFSKTLVTYFKTANLKNQRRSKT